MSFEGAWTNQVQNLVLVSGPGGVFVYSGVPAANNLFASSTDATTDPFGNVTIPGDAIYVFSGGTWGAIALAVNGSNPALAFYFGGATQASPYVLVSGIFGSGEVSGGVAVWGAIDTSPIYLAQVTGTAIPPNPASGDLLYCDSNNALNISNGGLISTGGTATHPSVLSTDTWHDIATAGFLNGWANTAGNVKAQYRMVASPPDSVEIIGAILATAASAVTFFTLPAGYRPASQQQVVAAGTGGVAAGTSCFIGCDTSGNLTVHNGTIGAANSYLFHGFISLDA